MKLSIRHSVMVVLAIGVAALVLAACGGGDDNGNATAASGSSSDVVSVKEVDGNKVLADAQGKTLYSADVEKGGMIKCTDGCTSFWDPSHASAKEAKEASSDLDMKFAVIKRPDGASQLAVDGKPLYTFTQEGSGQLKGDGFTDDFQGTHFEWSAATTNGGGGNGGGGSSSGGYSSPGGY
jgi:predicted lipoprotein with Yx(FWY)xxD motif